MTGSGLSCQVVGASVRGASHVRADLPNQDAVGWEDEAGHLIVCVADGHGSKKCFRSHVGSQLAVAAGLEVGRRFLDRVGGAGDAATARRRASESLPAALVAEWRRRVEVDLAASPLRADELNGVDEADRDLVAATPALAYGATLLAVLFSPAWVLVVQVGDGDVMFVSPAGETSRPVPKDARLIGNETTSLSAPKAEDDFRLAAVPLGADGPAVVIVSTDGFANAYADDASFLKVGSDVLAKVNADGMKAVDAELETWLSSASSYDGDDVSAVIVSLAATAPKPAASRRGAVPFEIER